MATKTKKPPRSRRPRQTKLPGMEVLSHPDIDEAAAEYVDVRENRMNLLKEEIEASNALLALMKEHGLSEYSYDSFKVTVMSSTKVKVKRAGEEENGDGE